MCPKQIVRASITVALAAFLTAGCGVTRNWKIDLAPDIPSAQAIRPVPAAVVIALPPGFGARESLQTITSEHPPYGSLHHVFHVAIGPVTAIWLEHCLSRSFAKVTIGDAAMPSMPWVLAFEPYDPAIEFSSTLGFGSLIDQKYLQGGHSAAFRCNVRVRYPDGRQVAEWLVQGDGFVDAAWTGTATEFYKVAGEAALVDACAALTVLIVRNRALLLASPDEISKPPVEATP